MGIPGSSNAERKSMGISAGGGVVNTIGRSSSKVANALINTN